MKFRKITLLLILGGLLTAVLTGCGKQNPEETQTESPSENETQSMNDEMIELDDMLSAADLLGKTYEECGLKNLPESSSTELKGTFCGIPAEGRAWFNAANAEKIPRLKSADFTIRGESIDYFGKQLTDLYSGPCDSGEEPYAKINGGSREWFRFDAGAAFVTISQGSEQDYISAEITQNPEPGCSGKLTLIKSEAPDYGIADLPLSMEIKASGYENGILTVEVTNQLGGAASYSNRYILAEETQAGDGYSEMTRQYERFCSVGDPETFEIADLETKELACDLRVFGKLKPGKYMLILDDMETEFELGI